MDLDEPAQTQRSYGCTFGCGNPYDYILVMVQDGTTEFLCTPCMIKIAADMVEAITNPDNPAVIRAMEEIGVIADNLVPGPAGKPRGRNAPATATSPDIFDAYDGAVTVDDLSEDFR
jgi:hypothetical protein